MHLPSCARGELRYNRLMPTRRLPLFPLGVVLFPGMRLPLHIFEERYKLMIGRCLQWQAPFGVVLASGNGIATIGCSALVEQVVKTYEDGRMDIVTTGQSAYRIQELHNDEPYLEGDVEFLDDERPLRGLQVQPTPALRGPQVPSTPGSGLPDDAKQLRVLFEKCYRLLHDNSAPPAEGAETVSLAYRVAASLPLDLETRQAVLETRVEADRQTLLIERLSRIMPELERVHAARSKVSGNGHALN